MEEVEQATEQEIVKLREAGKSIREIAAATGKPSTTVHRILAKTEVTEPEQPAEQKADQTEEHVHQQPQTSPPIQSQVEQVTTQPVNEPFHQDDLERTVNKAIATNDLKQIGDLLSRLEQRQTTLTATLSREQQRATNTQTEIDRLAARVVSAQDPAAAAEAELELTHVRSVWIEASALQQAIDNELKPFGRYTAILREAKERLDAAGIEAKQSDLLTLAREQLQQATVAFSSAVRGISERLSQISEVARDWNRGAKAWRLPEKFSLYSSLPLPELQKVLKSLRIVGDHPTAIPTVTIKLHQTATYGEARPGSTIRVSAEVARDLTSRRVPGKDPLAAYVDQAPDTQSVPSSGTPLTGDIRIKLNVHMGNHKKGAIVNLPVGEAMTLLSTPLPTGQGFQAERVHNAYN